MDKISINGLKLSNPLVMMRVSSGDGVSDAIPALCRLSTDLTVNIAFMTSTGLDDPHSAIGCIDPIDRSSLVGGLARNADLKSCVHIEPDAVGMLSIYPHRSSIAVLVTALQALNNNGICVHAMASSISALTFIVDYLQLDKAATVLADSMGLPPDTTPVRTEFRVRATGAPDTMADTSQVSDRGFQTAVRGFNLETIAVYREPIIRTYGFNLFEKLTLYQITLPFGEMDILGKANQTQYENDAIFRSVWGQTDTSDQTKIFLLCKDIPWNRLRPLMDCCETPDNSMGPIVQTEEVDVVCFQGPHFGDRCGIMDFTYKALAHGQIPLKAVTCSVATIYLVLPAGWGQKTQSILTEAFEIPTSAK